MVRREFKDLMKRREFKDLMKRREYDDLMKRREYDDLMKRREYNDSMKRRERLGIENDRIEGNERVERGAVRRSFHPVVDKNSVKMSINKRYLSFACEESLMVGSPFGKNAFFGHFLYGCLLYTSPSPRDLSTSRMPSSA